MSQINDPNIIKLIEFKANGTLQKKNGRQIKVQYYVMKLAHFGELFNFIEETEEFNEKMARYFFV